MSDSACEWCEGQDADGQHENGCRLGRGPDETMEAGCPALPLVCNADGFSHVAHVWDFGSGEAFACPGFRAAEGHRVECDCGYVVEGLDPDRAERFARQQLRR